MLLCTRDIDTLDVDAVVHAAPKSGKVEAHPSETSAEAVCHRRRGFVGGEGTHSVREAKPGSHGKILQRNVLKRNIPGIDVAL